MPDIHFDEPPQPARVREFQVGEVSAKQKGRVTLLTHPEFGFTYLIDTTDRQDPLEKKLVREVLTTELAAPENNNVYDQNNDVYVVITDKLSDQREKRIYSGIAMQKPDNPEIAITRKILIQMGMKEVGLYVPFSYDSPLVKQLISEEIRAAIDETRIDFPQLP